MKEKPATNETLLIDSAIVVTPASDALAEVVAIRNSAQTIALSLGFIEKNIKRWIALSCLTLWKILTLTQDKSCACSCCPTKDDAKELIREGGEFATEADEQSECLLRLLDKLDEVHVADPDSEAQTRKEEIELLIFDLMKECDNLRARTQKFQDGIIMQKVLEKSAFHVVDVSLTKLDRSDSSGSDSDSLTTDRLTEKKLRRERHDTKSQGAFQLAPPRTQEPNPRMHRRKSGPLERSNLTWHSDTLPTSRSLDEPSDVPLATSSPYGDETEGKLETKIEGLETLGEQVNWLRKYRPDLEFDVPLHIRYVQSGIILHAELPGTSPSTLGVVTNPSRHVLIIYGLRDTRELVVDPDSKQQPTAKASSSATSQSAAAATPQLTTATSSQQAVAETTTENTSMDGLLNTHCPHEHPHPHPERGREREREGEREPERERERELVPQRPPHEGERKLARVRRRKKRIRCRHVTQWFRETVHLPQTVDARAMRYVLRNTDGRHLQIALPFKDAVRKQERFIRCRPIPPDLPIRRFEWL